MSENGFFNAFAEAAKLPWRRAPKKVHDQAIAPPAGEPVPAPDEAAPTETLRPDDIRSSGLDEMTGGHLITRSLAGVDVTLMIVPPEGDDLWVLRGRVWLEDPGAGEAKVVLVQGENVLATVDVSDSEEFEFREILGSGWVLEFHLVNGEVVLLRGEWE